jgi:predicted hydrocarbon binding protein
MVKTEVKGLTLKSRYIFVEKTFGKDAIKKVLPFLRPETRALFEDELKIRATSWYDLDIQTDFETTVCKVLAGGDKGIYRKMGGYSVDYNETPYPDVSKFLQMYIVIFPRYCRPGRMEVEFVSDTECYVRLHDLTSTFPNCESNLGYIARYMEVLKLKDVRAHETHCTKDPGVKFCEYHFTWKL